jgi:hypothetical protein
MVLENLEDEICEFIKNLTKDGMMSICSDSQLEN